MIKIVERNHMTKVIAKEYTEFLDQLKEQIATSRYKAALAVNSKLILLYHHIGTEILKRQKEHGWGAKIIDQLSRDLRDAFPDMKGFSIQNLKYMRRFAEEYSENEIGQQAVDQLPWGHNIVIMYEVKNKEERFWYIKKSCEHGWSRNILSMQIETNLYKREGKAITNFRNKLISPQSDLAQQTLKNPYVFDFLSLGKKAHEREIEKALVAHIERFLLELGEGFAFLGRQYHLRVGDRDFYLDLIFYHIKLRSRVPANDVLHIYKPLRPGQIRGEPWLSSILLKLYELDQYDDAELVRKKTATMFAGFITRLDPEANILGEGESNEQGVALSGLEPGTMQLLDPGEDIKFSEPSDVGGSYEAFMRQQLRAIAIGTGITYEQLTGDLTGVNYSSIRAGLIEFRRRCAMLQHDVIVFQFCRPIWNRWLELATLSGELSTTDNQVFKDVKWIPQGFDWVDPLKDQQAQQMAVRNGFKSRAEVVSEMGYDVEEIDQEIAEDQKRANSLNLMFDSDCKGL